VKHLITAIDGDFIVPTRLPNKSRADAKARAEVMHVNRPGAANEGLHISKRRKLDAIETIDWLAIWAMSIAFSAIVMAGLVYFTERDVDGAAAILTGAAIIVAVALYGSKAPSVHD
jgi:hypothetical protein